jgi:small subunit ribosomal protein S2
MVLEQKRNNSMVPSKSKKAGTSPSSYSRDKEQTRGSVKTLVKKKVLRVGDICNLKISALSANNIGIDEYSLPCAVFVPIPAAEGTENVVGIGSQIKAKIVKIQESTYAVAQFIEGKASNSKVVEALKNVPVKPGEVLKVSFKGEMIKENAGIVELANNYRLIVPLPTNMISDKGLEDVEVTVTRVKLNYAFAKITSSISTLLDKSVKCALEVGSKFTTTLEKDDLIAFTKNKRKFVVLNVNTGNNGRSILFLKLKKGVSYDSSKDVLNNKVRVRVKITSKSENCAVGKILEFNPISKERKNALVLKNISEMINHGMHFGEKAVKCHARMKNYIWLTSNSGPTGAKQKQSVGSSNTTKRPLIKKGRHVINLLKTRRCLNKALNKLTKYALKGRTFLFIGTKKPAAGLVARASFFTKNSFYVNTRWLGGMLTNWKTICKSISKIRPILKEKQKVVVEILERRQAIKTRLIKKALLLRKKSKLILNKGRYLLETLRNDKDKSVRLNQAKQLTSLRSDLINKGLLYIEKRKKLIQKRRELVLQAQTLLLKEKGLELGLKYKATLNQLAIYGKKLNEYKYLLILASEIKNIKEANKDLISVSYGKLKEVLQTKQSNSWILPNPPKEILNKIVLTLLQSSNQNANNLSLNLNKDNSFNNSVMVCSTLLSKFSNFSSYIKSVIKSLIKSIQILEKQVKAQAQQLNQIKSTLQVYLNLKQKYVAELQLLKSKFIKERGIIRIVKRKLKALDAQKKLLKFLPRLRYLPTPQTKISQIVQTLLLKIVDPKLKYPIENIYDQKLNAAFKGAGGSKKLAAARKKKWQRLEKYFGGIANMTKLTKAQISRNVAIIIGQKEEMNAVRECQKLGIKMFTIVDTNCNPTLSDHIIPANDDSRSSIKYILTKAITRIRLAQKLRSRLSIYTK